MTDSDRPTHSAALSTDADGQLAFPCRYPVKAMTRTEAAVTRQVLSVITASGVPFDPESVHVRPSRNGRFQSITIVVDVASRDELERVYGALRAHDSVVMTL
ncbi:MAG: DUF493 domain-containing protein [Pseudomonadota bacterium]